MAMKMGAPCIGLNDSGGALDSPLKKKAGQDKAENNERTIQNSTDMGKKKKRTLKDSGKKDETKKNQ